jgi:hypothetical protein
VSYLCVSSVSCPQSPLLHFHTQISSLASVCPFTLFTLSFHSLESAAPRVVRVRAHFLSGIMLMCVPVVLLVDPLTLSWTPLVSTPPSVPVVRSACQLVASRARLVASLCPYL